MYTRRPSRDALLEERFISYVEEWRKEEKTRRKSLTQESKDWGGIRKSSLAKSAITNAQLQSHGIKPIENNTATSDDIHGNHGNHRKERRLTMSISSKFFSSKEKKKLDKGMILIVFLKAVICNLKYIFSQQYLEF